ncbi:MAG: hypothetical protein RL172_2661 [Bacteroidota bacterium]
MYIKKILNTFCVLLLGILAPLIPCAQEYSFTRYTAANGLPSSECIALAKDDKGFLWIGTVAGVCRYDGYQFKYWLYSSENHFIGKVNALKVIDGKRIWVAATSGLYCFINNELVKINAATNLPQGINDIAADTDGGLLLATENGPAIINQKQADSAGIKKIRIEDFVLPQWNRQAAAVHHRRATLISRAADGTLYVAQNRTLYRITATTIDSLFTTEKPTDGILTIFPVSKHKVYFDAGITEINKIENGQWQKLHISQLYKPGNGDNKKGIWYAGTSGVFLFDPLTAITSVKVDVLDKGVIWPSAVVKDGNLLWLATHDGLIKLKPNVFTHYTGAAYQMVNEVYNMLQLKDGRLLAGTNRGRLWQKTSTGFVNYFKGTQTFVPRAELKCLLQDNRGWLWAGTGYEGVAVQQPGGVHVLNSENAGLHDNTIECLLQADNGAVYAGGDNGVSELYADKQNRLAVKAVYMLPVHTKNSKVYAMVISTDGTLWVAGEEGVMYLKDGVLHSVRINNTMFSVRAMQLSADGSLWIATAGEGVLHCRFGPGHQLQLIKQYDETAGFNTRLFLHLLVDKDDNIWAASAKGLSYIGRNGLYAGRVLNFEEEDGFIQPGYASIKLCQADDGAIWASTTMGIVSFNPVQLFLSGSVPKVYITAVSQLRKELLQDNIDTLLAASANQPVKWAYNNSAVGFDYMAIDFANQQSLIYYYKMDGVDSSWITAGKNRTVFYPNLPPGSYRFRVKALNDKGVWSTQEAAFPFYINPPFWKTWWFSLLLLATTAVAIFAIIKRRETAAQKREAEKTAIEKLKAIGYQYQLETEQVINYFVTSINQQNSIDDMLWDVAKNCISKLGFEDCVIYLTNETQQLLVQKAAWGPKTTTEDKIVNPIEIPVGKGIVGAVALSARAEIIADTTLDNRYIVDDARRLSELAVPITIDGRVLGVIDSEHSKHNFYTQRHLQILTTIAALLADKIVKMNAQQQSRENELQVLQLNKDLATWQITALRAQMNPHFIFNAMNSIQQFTLQNDTENANLYISKFSTLLRKVLHTSQQNSITLEEEMEQLQLYLDIEQLRMGASFYYSVAAAEDIEADAVKIPGMLVQPFVENAVKHGLALKEGEKKLTIYFTMPDEYHLHAVVTDNGIGRQKAAALAKHQTLLPHSSNGIRLVKQRLQLLEQNKAHHAGILMDDLPDGTGTRVTVIIPVV